MTHFIGIDVGASFIKGAILDLDSLTIKKIIKYPTPVKSSSKIPGRFEIPGDKYYVLFKKLIATLSRDTDVSGIVISTQMHGMILVDKDYKAVTPFIGWQDERMHEVAPRPGKSWLELISEMTQCFKTLKCGIRPRSGLLGMTLFWLKENGVLKKYPKAKALFLGDYLAARLTRGKMLTHSTNACGSALFDVKKNQWDRELLDDLGIEIDSLPEVSDTRAIVGHYKIKGRSIPVFVSYGDLQCAVLGSLNSQETLSLNIGTGSQVSKISDRFSGNSEDGSYEIRSYFDNQFLNTVTHLPAGRALNVLINFIQNSVIYFTGKSISSEMVWKKLGQKLAKKNNSDGISARVGFFKNNLTGETVGSFSGITENNLTMANVFFSSLEAMAENYRNAALRLDPSHNFKLIILSGGLPRRLPVLKKLLEKKFAKKIIFAGSLEETLNGLLIIALVSFGQFKNVTTATKYLSNHRRGGRIDFSDGV